MKRASRILALTVAGCAAGSPHATPRDSPSVSPVAANVVFVEGERPYAVRLPRGYGGGRLPLVLALHAHGGSGAELAESWGLARIADAHSFILVAPDGTTSHGTSFWNATDACCDFDKTGVDDVAYLTKILEDVSARYLVDPKRVYVVGYSNGAAMAHRMACDAATRVAAVMSLEGAGWKDATRCRPAERVSILEVHGTADDVVAYDGGGPVSPTMAVYPGAVEEMKAWAARNGCTGDLEATGKRGHFVAGLAAEETGIARFGGCPAGGDVELWTVEGGLHFPELLPALGEAVWEFLARNPKP